MSTKKIDIIAASEMMREFEAKLVSNQDEGADPWTRRCATGIILIENPQTGKIVRTDLVISVNLDENGQLDEASQNPAVIHNAPNHTPQHEFIRLMSRNGSRGVWPWFSRQIAALLGTDTLLRHTPPEEEIPVSADVLGTPDDMPV